MTIARAATQREKLHIKLAISPCHSIWTSGLPVWRRPCHWQMLGSEATTVPTCKSPVWLNLEEALQGKGGFNPRSVALEADPFPLGHWGSKQLWEFLHHRTARVKLDESLCREIRSSEGVPQGSVLSPALFLQYVNNTVNTLPPRVTNSLHADDPTAWTSAEHTSTATRHASDHQQSQLLGRWVVHGNQLQQNTSNTLFTLHCKQRKWL